MATTALLKAAGRPDIARNRTKIRTPTIMEKIMTVALPVSKRESLKLFHLSFPEIKAIRKVPVAPAPPASVGVNTPV